MRLSWRPTELRLKPLSYEARRGVHTQQYTALPSHRNAEEFPPASELEPQKIPVEQAWTGENMPGLCSEYITAAVTHVAWSRHVQQCVRPRDRYGQCGHE
jgi:hypothetical protein